MKSETREPGEIIVERTSYASDNLEAAIEDCVDFINDHGGFTVVMRYSRGEINDKSFIGMANQSK